MFCVCVFQGIINIVYIVGVNPMAQGSSSMMYNPMLMMCQNLYQTSYSQMGGVGGFPMYNQYLYHYCFVDPQEVGSFCHQSLDQFSVWYYILTAVQLIITFLLSALK